MQETLDRYVADIALLNVLLSIENRVNAMCIASRRLPRQSCLPRLWPSTICAVLPGAFPGKVALAVYHLGH